MVVAGNQEKSGNLDEVHAVDWDQEDNYNLDNHLVDKDQLVGCNSLETVKDEMEGAFGNFPDLHWDPFQAGPWDVEERQMMAAQNLPFVENPAD